MKSILVMKPGAKGRRLADELAQVYPGIVFYWPAFTFTRPENLESTVSYIRKAASLGALLIVVSPTAAEYLHEFVPQLPTACSLAAVGGPTARRLKELYGAQTEVICPEGGSLESGSEALFDLLQSQGLPSLAVIVRGRTGREWLYERLKEADVKVFKAVIYDRLPLEASEADRKAIRENPPSLIYLTSTDAVDILLDNLDEATREAVKEARVLTIHPRIAQALEKKGFRQVELAESEGPEKMADRCLHLAQESV